MAKLTTIMNAPLGIQRLIAISVLLLFSLLVAAAMYISATNFKANAEQIVEKRFSLGRLKAVSELSATLEQSPTATENASQSVDFLEGSSEAVILASLQGRLNEIARKTKVTIQSVANLPVRTKENIRFAGVAADVQGTDEAIHALLFDIETSVPYLVIRKLNLRTVTVGGGGARGAPILVARVEFFGALSPLLAETVTQ